MAFLRDGIRLHQANETVLFSFTCALLHKWGIDNSEEEEIYLVADEDDDKNLLITPDIREVKRQR